MCLCVRRRRIKAEWCLRDIHVLVPFFQQREHSPPPLTPCRCCSNTQTTNTHTNPGVAPPNPSTPCSTFRTLPAKHSACCLLCNAAHQRLDVVEPAASVTEVKKHCCFNIYLYTHPPPLLNDAAHQRLAVVEPAAAIVEEDEVRVPNLGVLPLL